MRSPAVETHELQRAERDQPVSCPDIEEDVTGVEACVIEYAVSDRDEMFESLHALLKVIAVATVQQPRCLLVHLRPLHGQGGYSEVVRWLGRSLERGLFGRATAQYGPSQSGGVRKRSRIRAFVWLESEVSSGHASIHGQVKSIVDRPSRPIDDRFGGARLGDNLPHQSMREALGLLRGLLRQLSAQVGTGHHRRDPHSCGGPFSLDRKAETGSAAFRRLKRAPEIGAVCRWRRLPSLTVRVLLVAIGIALLAWLVAVAALTLVGRKVEAKQLARLLPDLAALLRGLLRDPRVPRGSKILVALAIAWVVSPIDLLPEFLPVIGPLDDVIVVALVLRHLVKRAGPEVVREHWPGDQLMLERGLRTLHVVRSPEARSRPED